MGGFRLRAAKKFGARGIGLDIDPQKIVESRANAKAAGVEQLVEFREQDVLTADISQATVVTLYLLSSANAQAAAGDHPTAASGTRIVSHAFSMGPTWPADTDRSIQDPDRRRDHDLSVEVRREIPA